MIVNFYYVDYEFRILPIIYKVSICKYVPTHFVINDAIGNNRCILQENRRIL